MSDIEIGDYVQWACRGMDMFKEPKRVRDISPCGGFAFVEGENTGLPIKEVTKVVNIRPEPAERFTFFWHGVFSQWHKQKFTVDGVEYNCAEQYMMAQKALMFNDKPAHHAIMHSDDPSDQKRLGRNVKNFIKDKWDAAAKDIVYKGNYYKFRQNAKLKEQLLATKGTTLVEASPYDQIWGIGLKEGDPRTLRRETWRGKNWLGEVLTKVRDDLEGESWKKA